MTEEPERGAVEPRTKGRRRPLVWFIKLAVSATLLTWVIARSRLSEVREALVTADLRFVGLAFALNAAGWIISTTRWRVLLATTPARVTFHRLLTAYMSALFFNNLLPSTVGGDALRIYDSTTFGAGRSGAVVVIAADRILGFLSLLLLAVLALPLAPSLVSAVPLLPLWLGGAIAALLLLVLLALAFGSPTGLLDGHARILPPRILQLIERASDAFRRLRQNPRAIVAALGLSFLLQLSVIAFHFMLARALGLDLPSFEFAVILPLALVVMAIPISVNAIGLRESAFGFFLGLLGVPTSQALAFSWLAFGMVLLQGAIGGVVYALRRS